MSFRGVIQRYGNVCEQRGEYAREAMLICPPNGHVHCMPLPIVAHQRNRYSVHAQNGVKFLKQHRVFFEVRVLVYVCTCSCVCAACEPPRAGLRGFSAAPDARGAVDVYYSLGGGSDAAGGGGMTSTCMRVRPPVERFCSDVELDNELRELHGALAAGDRGAQLEIDRRLHAAAAADGGWLQDASTQRVPLAWLYTLPEDTVQYARLPDVLRVLTRGVARQSWADGPLAMLVHNALPCLKRGRLFATPLGTAPLSDVVATCCLGVLHGTLLGLYPECAKRPLFGVRRDAVVRLRALATGAQEARDAFLRGVPNLLRLALMEYLANAVSDFCPSEVEQYLAPPALAVFRALCTNTCDAFRTEALQGDAGWGWAALERQAGVLVDRLARTCKPRPARAAAPVARTLAAWRKACQGRPRAELLATALATRVAPQAGSLRAALPAADAVRCHTAMPCCYAMLLCYAAMLQAG